MRRYSRVRHNEQTLAVYDAEADCDLEVVRAPITKDEMEGYVNLVVSGKTFQKYAPHRLNIHIQFISRGSMYLTTYHLTSSSFLITVPDCPKARRQCCILHELAHVLCDRHEQHGKHFIRMYLRLVKEFLGTHYHDNLKQIMIKKGAL